MTHTFSSQKANPPLQPHDAVYVAYTGDSRDAFEQKLEQGRLRAEKENTLTKAEADETKKTLKARKARTKAILRLKSSQTTKPEATSPILEILASVANSFNLSKAQTKKAAEVLKNPQAASKLLKNAASLDLSKLTLSKGDKELLKSILTSYQNGPATDILKAVGVDPSKSHDLINLIKSAPSPKNGGSKSFLDAIADADSTLADVITAISKNDSSLVELHQEVQAISAKNLEGQIKYIREQLHHEIHEIDKQKRLSIVKKVFGAIAAALLIVIGALTARPSLIAIGVLVAVTTAKPNLIADAINNLCRDMGLKGAAAESVSILIKATIAAAIAVCSCGTGVTGAFAFIGSTAGTFAMAGGVDNVAFLEGDIKSGKHADLRESDPENSDVQKYEQVGNYATLGVSLSFGLASLSSSIPKAVSSGVKLGARALTALRRIFTSVEALSPEANATEGAAESALQGTQAIESSETTTANATSASDSSQVSALKKSIAFVKKYVHEIQNMIESSNNGAQSIAAIVVAVSLLALAGYEKNLGISQSNLNQQETAMQGETQSFRKDMTSVKATTTQAIDQLSIETNIEQRAFAEQIIGNVS